MDSGLKNMKKEQEKSRQSNFMQTESAKKENKTHSNKAGNSGQGMKLSRAKYVMGTSEGTVNTNLKSNDSDEVYRMVQISGATCIIQARNVNGMIKGHLTCQISSKNFKYDMNPTQSKKTNIDLHGEVSRLYFGMKKNKNGKEQLTLQNKDSIDDAERIKSFLVNLDGSYCRHLNINIEHISNRSLFRISLKIKDNIIIEEVSQDEIMDFLENMDVRPSSVTMKMVATYVRS